MNAAPDADIAVDDELVRRLLHEQYPHLADRTLVEAANGWDNVIFRLGDDLSVRVPRRLVAAGLVANEQRWLPVLAPRLPLPIPVPVHAGRPSDTFPFHWSVCRWFEGASAADDPPADLDRAADDLGAFVSALHVPAPDDAPENPVRGVHLATRAAAVDGRIERLARLVDVERTVRLWRELVATPIWPGPPLWLHGDLHPANVVVTEGRLSAVIDFGDITAGDPATDLSIAWMLFGPAERTRFREAIGVDDDTWRRAAGWALSLALAYLDGSPEGSPMIPVGHTTLAALLDDLT
jgi:aminoglycoside phosphotransferase (APT) family kinase protein